MLMFNSFFFCLLQTLNIQTKYAENKKKKSYLHELSKQAICEQKKHSNF